MESSYVVSLADNNTMSDSAIFVLHSLATQGQDASMQMSRVCTLGAPIVLFLFSLIVFPLSAAEPLVETRKEITRENRRKFTAFTFQSFDEFGAGLADLRIPEDRRTTPPQLLLSARQEELLQRQIRYFLRSIRAATFDDYWSAVRGDYAADPVFKGNPVRMMTEMVSRKLLTGLEVFTPPELFEIHWAVHTNVGRGATFFTGLALEASRYQLLLVTKTDTLERSVYDLEENRSHHMGRREMASVFHYGTSPREYVKAHGSMTTAIVRIHIRQYDEFAYPCLLWVGWCDALQRWIPITIAELVQKRSYFPIY